MDVCVGRLGDRPRLGRCPCRRSHRKKRMKQIKKMAQRGLLDPEKEDPFALFVASTQIRCVGGGACVCVCVFVWVSRAEEAGMGGRTDGWTKRTDGQTHGLIEGCSVGRKILRSL